MSDVTVILSQIEAGDSSAAEQLLPLVYEELRRLATARMASERADHTLQATALVHEAYLRLVDVERAQHWDTRGHFYTAAAEAMRRILVESARRKQAARRGGKHHRLELHEDIAQTAGECPDNLLDLNTALEQLAIEEPQIAELVKMRLFAGLTMAEACQVLAIPSSTAYESWEFARAWFTCKMNSTS